MDWIYQLFSLVLGSGIISMLLFYRPKKRKEMAEAEKLENTNEQDEVSFLEDRLRLRDQKIDTLYIELRTKEREYIELLKQYNTLIVEQEVLKIKRCDIRGCTLRKPPSEY